MFRLNQFVQKHAESVDRVVFQVFYGVKRAENMGKPIDNEKFLFGQTSTSDERVYSITGAGVSRA
jgi:hypothetical protein